MNRLTFLLLCTAGTASLVCWSGCRSARDNQMDIMERELRSQEDYIYELEDYVMEYSEKLRQCRCSQPTSLGPNIAEPVLSQPSTSSAVSSTKAVKRHTEMAPKPAELRSRPESSILEDSEPLPIHSPEEDVEDFENLEAPELHLEIGEPISATEQDATPLAGVESAEVESGEDPQTIPDPATFPAAAVEEPAEEAQVDPDEQLIEEHNGEPETSQPTTQAYRPAERLVITHVFRGPGEEAPESLLAVVEARDERNEPADFNGKVSLMVMTSGEKQKRIKRWDFTPEETSQAWQTSHLGDGLHLELPLETAELPDVPCQLWVRLETFDGDKILAQVPFEATRLATIDQASPETLASAQEEPDRLEIVEVEPEVINPLRSGNRKAKRASSRVKTTSLESSDQPTKVEPRWRAATHFSSGPHSGFATTASDQQWSTTSLPRQTQREARSSQDGQRWISRK